MSNSVALQADIGNIPSNTLGLLDNLTPLLKALSADNVQPLAVLQTEVIGNCFHINGDMAAKVPDLLVRSTSMRLQRLSYLAGWMAGDTASAMAQTAGGRAASLLSMVLVELYGQKLTGMLLEQLSSAILSPDRNHSSRAQLGEVAGKLHNKLAPLAFGSHLALHVTRIRQAYFLSEHTIPGTLLDNLSVETMAEFLAALHGALYEESSILYVEGFQGLGPVVALVMALCPDDVMINVENEILFQGERRSIVISLKTQSKTKFGLETIVREKQGWNELVLAPKGGSGIGKRYGLSQYDNLSMRLDRCLSDVLELTLAAIPSQSSNDLRHSVVELITAIVFSFTRDDLYPPIRSSEESLLPPNAFMSLLGPDAANRVRDKLKMLFGVEPPMSRFDCLSAYHTLHALVGSTVPFSTCEDRRCAASHPWAYFTELEPHCAVTRFWREVGQIIGNAVILLFIDHSPNACVSLGSPNKLGPEICFAMMRRLLAAQPGALDKACEVILSRPRIFEPSPFIGLGYTMTKFHEDICTRIDVAGGHVNTIGVSNGSVSIIPSTLQDPLLNDLRTATYILVDGQFHDRRNYYTRLESDPAAVRCSTEKSVLDEKSVIALSGVGAHSALTMTIRPHLDFLILRTMIQVSGETIYLNFLDLHIASMNVSFCKPCAHDPREPLDKNNGEYVIPTSVAAPLATGKRISLVLTHRNPEAQFLCGIPNVPTLFQWNSCLNCVAKEARENGFRMIIQS